jgi:hypothetical protein
VSVIDVVCWSAPEVAVTVTVDVIGAGDPLAPHPPSTPNPTTLTTSINNACKRRLFFDPMQHNTAANTVPGKSGL